MTGSAASAVWIILLAATLASYWCSRHVPAHLAILAIMMFAGVKAALILLHFMEVRHAPAAVPLFFAGWIAACAGLVAILHEAAH